MVELLRLESGIKSEMIVHVQNDWCECFEMLFTMELLIPRRIKLEQTSHCLGLDREPDHSALWPLDELLCPS